MHGELLEMLSRSQRRKLPILQSAPTDCQECGACCVHYQDINVDLGDDNHEWLEANGYLKAGNFTDPYDVMIRVNGRCTALVGEVGKQTSCSIYEHRPESCRNYKPKTSRCRTSIIMEINRPKCDMASGAV